MISKKTRKKVIIEFFMTYGWAVMLFLIALGMFCYFVGKEEVECVNPPECYCWEYLGEETFFTDYYYFSNGDIISLETLERFAVYDYGKMEDMNQDTVRDNFRFEIIGYNPIKAEEEYECLSNCPSEESLEGCEITTCRRLVDDCIKVERFSDEIFFNDCEKSAYITFDYTVKVYKQKSGNLK